MKLTVICENSVSVPIPRGLIGEHGLSFLIENGETTLFDTGQGVGLVSNLKAMGKDSNAVNRIIISHGHYDHTGGLMPFLNERDEGIPVHIHDEAFIPKLARIELPDKNLDIPIGLQQTRDEYEDAGAQFTGVSGFNRISETIRTISDIPRPKEWRSWDTRLKRSTGGKVSDDPFNDDLSLVVETGSGPVLLLGCAHAGIIEIMEAVKNETGHDEFYAVIGGTHLESAAPDYLSRTADVLMRFKVQVIAPSHCTGFTAASFLRENFPDKFRTASVGDTFEF